MHVRRLHSLLLLLLALLWLPGAARADPDDAPIVELITYHPGDEVWTRFGHIAIRIVDPVQRTDLVYNFGYATFDRPSFAWEYVRGTADFRLGVREFPREVYRYRNRNRTTEYQRLNLSPRQARRLADRLRWQAQPENATYRYEQLTDNCATRVRDLLDEITEGALRRAVADRDPGRTYRAYSLEYATGRLELLIGFDFIFGANQDRPVTGWDELYLPLPIRDAVSRATLHDAGETRPLAQPSRFGVQRRGPPANSGNPHLGRYVMTGLGFGLAILVAWPRIRRDRWGARLGGAAALLAGLALGLLGTLVGLLVVFGGMPDYTWNENAICWLPTDLVLVGLGSSWMRRGRAAVGPFMRRYAAARCLVVLGVAVGTAADLLPQDNWAFLALPGLVFGAVCWVSRQPLDPLDAPAEEREQIHEQGDEPVDRDSQPEGAVAEREVAKE